MLTTDRLTLNFNYPVFLDEDLAAGSHRAFVHVIHIT